MEPVAEENSAEPQMPHGAVSQSEWPMETGTRAVEPPPDLLHPLDELLAKGQVRERPFVSHIPIIGRLIAWFRAAWNSVSTKWYVLPLLQQQNEFNAQLVSYLRALEERLDDLDERLISMDRDQTALARNVSELTLQLVQMTRLLTAIEARRRRPDADSHEV